ncbi:hypothetical protein [Penaeicola halotolerans]|uniref:hypothetical protein n=1 Tax=Penaeicola halotolerans TaxID=2793196 RepID=UPI001CF7F40B|nr:hypothetical protein [Penaeicola halotolerans]
MEQITPFIIDDAEFVQLSNLPTSIADMLKKLIPDRNVLTLNYQGIELKDCISFEDFNQWFDYFNYSVKTVNEF